MNPDSAQKRISFGYDRENGKIVLHVGQSAAVTLIFQYYANEGRSIASIKETLEDIGIPSPLNNKKWNKQTIANILSNPHYLGNDIYPTIISRELFNKAQILKKDNIGNNGYTIKKDNNLNSIKESITSSIEVKKS
jgi:hypothetical protein